MTALPNPCGPALLRWHATGAPDASARLAVAYSAGADSTALLLAAHGFVLSAHTMVDDEVGEDDLDRELEHLVRSVVSSR